MESPHDGFNRSQGGHEARMKQLTGEAYSRARAYVLNHGLDLDRSLFTFRSESGTREQVFDALASYQNEDGGFGRALEPDLRSDLSSVYATSQGLSLLREIGATSTDYIVERAMAYISSTYDRKRKVWPIISAASLEAPCAGHWESIIDSHDCFVNMRAGLTGHLWHYGDLIHDDISNPVTEAVISDLLNTPDEKLVWIFSLWSHLGLAEAHGLPLAYREKIVGKLSRAVPLKLESDPSTTEPTTRIS